MEDHEDWFPLAEAAVAAASAVLHFSVAVSPGKFGTVHERDGVQCVQWCT